MKTLIVFLLAGFFGLTSASGQVSGATEKQPSVGVFYFPGWHDGAPGLLFNPPWNPIKKFPEREPAIGWYDDASVEVLRQQQNWMRQYGVDYVVFDWYWDGTKPFLAQAINAYKSLDEKLPYAVMWANHDAEPRSEKSFSDMTAYWMANYFSQKSYLSIDGRPVVFIFSGDALEKKALEAKVSAKELLAGAQRKARAAGLKGIYFVVGTQANTPTAKAAEDTGYSAYFAYNYHSGKDGFTSLQRRNTHSFTELTEAYKSHWKWFEDRNSLPYFVPVTAGWDKRPWGGSQDPMHDQSISTAEQFGSQLIAAARQKTPRRTNGFNSILVCCWNEYGEGSIVEPTKKFGFQYLEQIQKVSPGFQLLSE